MRDLYKIKVLFHFLPHPVAIDRLAERDPNRFRRRYFESKELIYNNSDEATDDYELERNYGIEVKKAFLKRMKEVYKWNKKKELKNKKRRLRRKK